MTAVKVCGITRIEDARLAWESGAAALGFVFHPGSPRAVTVQTAVAIRQELPGDAVCVGVFVDRPLEEMRETAQTVGLAAVQLHGCETPETVARLDLPVIKALRAEDADDGRLAAYRVAAFLLDASHPTMPGGTGRLADWDAAARLAQRVPLILAGGLHAGNVGDALRRVRPRGLDLSSGVEASPGLKDPRRLRNLFLAIPSSGVRPCLF